MTRRMIDASIWKNDKFGALPPMARLLQIGLINHADEQGRGRAHPALLRSKIFPYDDVSVNDIIEWLAMIEANGAIRLFADGKDDYQLVDFQQGE